MFESVYVGTAAMVLCVLVAKFWQVLYSTGIDIWVDLVGVL